MKTVIDSRSFVDLSSFQDFPVTVELMTRDGEMVLKLFPRADEPDQPVGTLRTVMSQVIPLRLSNGQRVVFGKGIIESVRIRVYPSVEEDGQVTWFELQGESHEEFPS